LAAGSLPTAFLPRDIKKKFLEAKMIKSISNSNEEPLNFNS
ncbi:2390_t:CDS:1, partial [Gigaspora rosea]